MTFPLIISAVIALIILVVLVTIFTNKVGWFNRNTATCESSQCISATNPSCEGGYIIRTSDCDYYDPEIKEQDKKSKELGKCCVPLNWTKKECPLKL